MTRRHGTAVVAAAAVLMITVGVGVAVWQRDNGRPEPAAYEKPVPAVLGMTAVGDLISAGAKHEWSQTVTADGRIYASAETPGSATVTAFDATTGRRLWDSQRFGEFLDLGGPIAFPGGLVIRVGGTLHLVNPETGKVRWKLTWKNKDEFAVNDRTFVRMSGNGTTEGFDLVSGERLWSVPGGADRPVRTAGTPVDSFFGPEILVSDDGLVQVTAGGRVVQRDMRTGEVRRTVEAGLPGAWFATVAGDRVLTGFQGNDGGPYLLRSVDLAKGKTSTLFTAPNEISAGPPQPCGTGRLCLRLWDEWKSEASVAIVDSSTGQVTRTGASRYQVPPTLGAGPAGVLLTDLVTTTIYRPDGQEVHNGPGSGQWIDENDVLWRDSSDTSVAISAISAANGRKTEIGRVGGRLGNCALTADVLACPVGPSPGSPASPSPSSEASPQDGAQAGSQAGLRIWRFTR